jgi:hypothetical protein
MKKLATILTAFVMLFTISAFAYRTDEIPARVKTALAKNFTNATNVTWQKGDNQGSPLYLADFSWNLTNVKAAFDEQGNLLSISRKLTIAELPLKISLAVEKKYKDYTIQGDALEIIIDEQATYKFKISNGVQTINLTSDPTGFIEETN